MAFCDRLLVLLLPCLTMIAVRPASAGETGPSFLPASAAAPNVTCRRRAADILPPVVLLDRTSHPLQRHMRRFLENQTHAHSFADTGLTSRDYLAVIEGQVAAFRSCQIESGVIIDPVEKIEWQYSTPCYALSAAILAASRHNVDPGLLESGVRAMSASVDEMCEYRTAHNHGEL